MPCYLFALGLPQPGMSIDNLDVQLVGPLDNLSSVLSGDSVRDLSGIAPVVHHEHLQLLDVHDDKAAEAVRHHVASLGVAAIADRRHRKLTAETAAHAVINTSRFAP